MELNCGIQLIIAEEDEPVLGDLTKTEPVDNITSKITEDLINAYETRINLLVTAVKRVKEKNKRLRKAYNAAVVKINLLDAQLEGAKKDLQVAHRACFVKLEKLDLIKLSSSSDIIHKNERVSLYPTPGSSPAQSISSFTDTQQQQQQQLQQLRVHSPTPSLTDSASSASTKQTLKPLKYKLETTPAVETSKKRKFVDSTKQNAKKRKKLLLRSGDYEIEFVKDCYVDLDQVYWYEVKWKDYTEKYNTWELLENLVNCNLVLLKHLEKNTPSDDVINELKLKITHGEFKNVIVNMPPTKDGSEPPAKMQPYDLIEAMKRSRSLTVSLTAKILNYLTEYDERVMSCDLDDLHWLKEHYNEQLGYVLRCILAMKEPDPGLYRRCEHYILLGMICRWRNNNLHKLKKWEEELQTLDPSVCIENKLDFELKPDNFTYITQNIIHVKLSIKQETPTGCKCEECTCKSKCCNTNQDYFAYSIYGLLKISTGSAIYECGKYCLCDSTCINRTVQNGSKVKLIIFRSDRCGWGVKAKERIKKGTFVMEYVGEIITNSCAEERETEYAKKGLKYIFDLDFNEEKAPTNCVDATRYGNVSRFVNHSCSPNLAVFSTFVDVVDENVYRLAMFAIKDIKSGEELTFDYEMNVNYEGVDEEKTSTEAEVEPAPPTITTTTTPETPKKKISFGATRNSPHSKKHLDCKCNSENCRKKIWFSN